jgi:hypothetical protein
VWVGFLSHFVQHAVRLDTDEGSQDAKDLRWTNYGTVALAEHLSDHLMKLHHGAQSFIGVSRRRDRSIDTTHKPMGIWVACKDCMWHVASMSYLEKQ